MSVWYGGIKLVVPDAAAVALVEQGNSLADVQEFRRYTWPPAEYPNWPVPTTRDLLRPVKLGTLFWPQGAQRWSIFHYLVHQPLLDRIRKLVYVPGPDGNPTAYNALALKMADGKDDSVYVQTDMFMLPPRPVNRSSYDPATDWWVLTLVDARYFWWDVAADIQCTAGTTTWAELYDQIADALEIDLTADDVSSAYLTPDLAAYQFAPLPKLLDAVAASVGHKIVRNLDGTVLAQSYTTALDLLTDNLSGGYQKGSGGSFAFDPAQDDDLTALAPASVLVAFPRADNGILAGTSHPVQVTLGSLDLDEYEGISGRDGVQLLNSSATANFLGSSDPANNTEIVALAIQMATDWYLWRTGPLDLEIAGIWPWSPEGLHDHIEWDHGGTTRIQRPEWNDLGGRGLHYGTYGAANETNITFEDVTVQNLAVVQAINIAGNTTLTVGAGFELTVVGWINWQDPVNLGVVTCASSSAGSSKLKAPSADTTIDSATWTDLTGSSATLTLAVAAKVAVFCDFHFYGDGVIAVTVGDQFEGRLLVDGSTYGSQVAPYTALTTTGGFAIDQNYLLTATNDGVTPLPAGTYTLKLQARRSSGVGGMLVGAANSNWLAVADGAIVVEKTTVALPNGTIVYGPECFTSLVCCATGAGSGSGIASGATITYVTASDVFSSTTPLVPTINWPIGIVDGNLAILIIYSPSFPGDVYLDYPLDPWIPLYESGAGGGGGGKKKDEQTTGVWWRVYRDGDPVPVIRLERFPPGHIILTQIIFYSGFNQRDPISKLGEFGNNISGSNIGPIPGIKLGTDQAVVVVGHRVTPFTSTALLTGDGLTYHKIAESGYTALQYAINSGPIIHPLTDKTFVVTGGVAGYGFGYMFAINGATTSDCDSCEDGVVSVYFHFTLTGITNGLCTNCSAALNTTHVIRYAAGCVWETSAPSSLCLDLDGADTFWRLTYNGTFLDLTWGDVTYQAQVTDWDCMSQVTLLRMTGDGVICDDYPSSITIYPGASGGGGGGGGGTTTCSNCSGGLCSNQFTFTPSGMTNGSCVDCNNLNITFTLTTSGAGTCIWTTPTFILCAGGNAYWKLTQSFLQTTLTLYSGDGVTIAQEYTYSGSWDCLSQLTLTLVSTFGYCNPAGGPTITINPV